MGFDEEFPNGIPQEVAFASDTDVIASFVGGSDTFIDLNSPSLGTQFIVDPPAADNTLVDLGTLRIVGTVSLTENGSLSTLDPTDTVSLTIPGHFNGIASVFALQAGQPSCLSGGPVLGTGVVTETGLSFSLVPLDNASFLPIPIEICAVADGRHLLEENVPPAGGLTIIYARGPGVGDFLGGTVTNRSNAIRFYGGSEFDVTDTFFGDNYSYNSRLRFDNGTPHPQKLSVIVEPYAGGGPLVGSLGTFAANTGTLFSVAQICAAAHCSLTYPQLASVTLIAVPGGERVTAGSLLLNPYGVLDNPN